MTQPSAREVLIERSFAAPLPLVWRAHTEPALVQRWMIGPPGHSMPVCELDVREGGHYRYVWQMPEGVMTASGTFVEVVVREKLVFTQIFEAWPEDETLITTRFNAQGGNTLVSVLIAYESERARDAVLATGMAQGMEMSYSRLDRQLESTV